MTQRKEIKYCSTNLESNRIGCEKLLLQGALDNSQSTHQPTHLEPIQRPVCKAFKRQSHGGQYDLTCTPKNGLLNAYKKGKKEPGQEIVPSALPL